MNVNIISYETGWEKTIEVNHKDNKFLNTNDIYVSFHAPSKIQFICKTDGIFQFTGMIKSGGSPNFSLFYVHNNVTIPFTLSNKVSIKVKNNDNITIYTSCEDKYKKWCYIVLHDTCILNEKVNRKIKFSKHNHLGDSISIIYGLEKIGIENDCIFYINGGKVMEEIISVFNINHVKYEKTYDEFYCNGDDIFSLCSWENSWIDRFYNAYNSFFGIYSHPSNSIVLQNDVFTLREPFKCDTKSGVIIQFDSRSEEKLSDDKLNKIIKWCAKPVSVVGGPDTKKYLGNNYQYLIGNLKKNIHDMLSCDLFIGSDSGMAHLAGILNVPSIVVAMRQSTYNFHKYKNTVVVSPEFFGKDIKLTKYDTKKIEKVLYGIDNTTVDVTKIVVNNNISENNNTEIDKLLGFDILNGKFKNLYIDWKDGGKSCVRHGDVIRELFKKNIAIYFTPVGKQYREMCAYAVKSIVNSGKYGGKIVIFCDEKDDNIQSVERYCDVIVMKFDCHPLVNRIYALEFMSSTYDSILYLDCDVLVYGDINNLFCYEDAVMYMEEPWHYNKNTVSGMIDTYYFTEDEKNNTYGNYHPINSGHFSVSGKYKDEFFVTYKGKYETRMNFSWGQDQSCLNYIVRTNMVKSKVYGKNTIGISTHLSSEEYKKYDLIHFAGHGDRVELMRKLCEKM